MKDGISRSNTNPPIPYSPFESGNAEDLKKKIEKLWGDKKLCAEYSVNCKDISFDTIDEYYEKIMKVYQ